MTRISKKKLDQKKLDEIKEQFSHLMSSLVDRAEVGNFFEEFLTSEEKIMLTKRLVLLMLIKKGLPYFPIKNALNVSYETIRTHKNLLKYKNVKFHRSVEKLMINEKTDSFFKNLESLMKPITLTIQARNNMKARAKLASGNW